MFKMPEIIKNLRKKCKYTQKQMAEMLKIDRSTYSYYELGKISPDINTIFSLAKIFNVNYTEILDSEYNNTTMFSDFSTKNNQKPNQNIHNIYDENLSEEEKDIIFSLRLLSYESKREVLTIINEKFKSENKKLGENK